MRSQTSSQRTSIGRTSKRNSSPKANPAACAILFCLTLFGASLLALPDISSAEPAVTLASKDSAAANVNPEPLAKENAFGIALRGHVGTPDLPQASVEGVGSTPRESSLSLSDAIMLSLAQNPSFAITRLGPTLADQEVLSAQGIYDTILRAGTDSQRLVEPSESAITGDVVTVEKLQGGIALDQKLPSGADLSVSWDSSRTENDSRFTTLMPLYRSSAALTLSQPLLRGTGWGAPGVIIRIARASSQASRDAYEAQVADQVLNVIRSYWNEVRARELVEVRKRGVELSERLQSDIEAGVKVGQLAPLSLSEADAQAAISREQLIFAENLLLEAGRELRQVTGIDFIVASGGFSDFAPIRASDRPQFAPVSFDASQSVDLALATRAELRAQKERLRLADLSAKLASNHVLPELTLEGRAGLQGLSGTNRGIDTGFGSGPSPYEGGYGDALDDLRSGDFYDYTVGLNFRMPLENREARAEFNRKKIALLSEQHRLRALTQTIIEETLSAVSSLEASHKRVKASEEAVRASTQSLEVQRDKFNAGLATVREVLESQRDLSESELRLAQALTESRISLAEALRARGELLGTYNLAIDFN